MEPTIIGVCGRAGSGKSSVARHLREHYDAQPLSFAEPLKRMAMDIWGFSEEQVFGEASIKEAPDPRTGITPRWAMQQLGEAARQYLGEGVWIVLALARVEEPRLYVIEDVRYINEARMISALPRGFVIRLHCSDSISTDDGKHRSEYEVDLIPEEYILADLHVRMGKLPTLFALVDDVMRDIDDVMRDIL